VTDPAGLYRAEEARWAAQLEALERRFRAVGLIRLAVFLLGVIVAIAAVMTRGVSPAWVIPPVIGFVALIAWHERIARGRDAATRSRDYYRRGLGRLAGEWASTGDDGARYADPGHLFTSDLEVFGRGSLFQLLSTARTETGAARLADWLASGAPPSEIEARQAAVRELAGMPVLRHDLAVIGPNVEHGLDSATLRSWATAEPVPFAAWLTGVARAGAALNLLGLVGWGLGWWPGYLAMIPISLSIVVTTAVRRRVRAVLEGVDAPERQLVLLAELLDRLATAEFQAPWLAALTARWRQSGEAPGAEVRRLARYVDLVDARRNQLFLPIAGVLLLGTQLAIAIEGWRRRVGRAVVDWVEAVGDLEAVGSLATFAFEHPDDVFPSIRDGAPGLDAVGLAHPLLAESGVVRNEVRLLEPCRLIIVSGSNMSGKSTLLKAIGTNLVLAQAGAPVRARALTAPPYALGASLVLRDSLLEGRSRFYAEIIRLRDVVTLTEGDRPVLFLLDELLSGTNSHDRAIGARGLLLGLIERGAAGFVTTHDLALTAIADELGPRAANWHLEDRLVDGTLEFDYRLAPGVVERSNALELMRSVGLEIPPQNPNRSPNETTG